MWHNNKKVTATYANHTSCSAWAEIEGVGWRRIREGAADGCTNLFIMLNAARANDRLVHVYIDDAGLITTAYLL